LNYNLLKLNQTASQARQAYRSRKDSPERNQPGISAAEPGAAAEAGPVQEDLGKKRVRGRTETAVFRDLKKNPPD
jgi:hypothetical protein